ncbi:hypothetical protein J4229_01390 [Candidatus Pacearchaeota archaeon]|nr:hypothetical protein [Candidatus Pacearchaeota archaeon]
MRFLSGNEKEDSLNWFEKAIEEAKKSGCKKAKSGALIIKGLSIFGEGHSSPPGYLESQRRCFEDKSKLHLKITDKTCCIHAEDRAVNDVLTKLGINYKQILKGSRIYYIRLDLKDNPIRAGQPYCTSCSKRVLDVGISEWALWHDEGIAVYTAEEYNLISYQFKG